MIEEFVDAVAQPVEAGTEDRIERRILRALYHKKEPMPEGRLANYVQETMTSSGWRFRLAHLAALGMVRILPVFCKGFCRRIALTETGFERAMELSRTGKDQL